MLRELSEEVRVTLKDRLRDVRHAIRRHRHDGGSSVVSAAGRLPLPPLPFPVRVVEDALGHAVSAFDDAMTLAETLVPIGRPTAGGASARSFAVYFPAGDDREALAGARAFRRDLRYLARDVAARRKVSGLRVHEAELAAVHAAMRERHGDLLDALARDTAWPQRVSAAAALCAALLIELLDHRPLRFDGPDPAQEAGRAVEILCLTPPVLACGFATVDPDSPPEPDLLDSAVLAAEARLDRILPACRGADAEDELTRIFATLLAHLP